MDDAAPKELANTAAKLLRALGCNPASASIVARLAKLDLNAVARVLEGAPVVSTTTVAPEAETVKALQRDLAAVREIIRAGRFADKQERAKSDTSKAEGGGFRRGHYQNRFPSRVCVNCRRHFLASREDAKTCSPKCRVALHRKSKGR